jgi:cobalt-zinc-cadmium efflux system outer membrane protein
MKRSDTLRDKRGGWRMLPVSCRWVSPALALVLTAGCLYPVRDKVDRVVCDLAVVPRDEHYRRAAEAKPTSPASDPQAKAGGRKPADKDATLTLVSAQKPAEPDQPRILDRLKIPDSIPGASSAKDFKLPELKPENKAERDRIINEAYPPLEPLGPDPTPLPGPDGHALSLSDLQRMALEKHPTIRQAAAKVEAARGAAIQAGLPPNPTFGPQGDTAGTNGGPTYQGFFFDQPIRLPNKLQLQRAIAAMDLKNAEVALRRAETDLSHQVRGNYFAVLVAQENMRVTRGLVDFTTSVYEIQLDQLKGGIAAAYEPRLLEVSALQARLLLYQARNQYESAWKTLAASLGRPGMAATELAGRLDIPVPVYDHAKILAYALDHHTDILTAENSLLQSKYQLRLAQLQPISDVDVHVVVQKDFTAPPNEVVHSVQLGFTIPLWDRNQGGIIQAQGNTVAASEQSHLIRVNLTTTLAQAFLSYENNRIAVDLYRNNLLPKQVQAYRALYQRYQGEKAANSPAFADVINAQQTLVTNVQAYVAALGALWQSVTDVADVAQTDDLYQIGNEPVSAESLEAVPDLNKLKPLPCCHPCADPDAAIPSDNGVWRPAVPGKDVKPTTAPSDGVKKAAQSEPPGGDASDLLTAVPKVEPPLKPVPAEAPTANADPALLDPPFPVPSKPGTDLPK